MWIKNNITAKIIKLTLLTTICIVSLSFSSLANTNYYAGGEPGVRMGMQVEGQLAYSRDPDIMMSLNYQTILF